MFSDERHVAVAANQNLRAVDQGTRRRAKPVEAVFTEADHAEPGHAHDRRAPVAVTALTAAAAIALPPRRPRSVK